MSQAITLTAESRQEVGKADVRRLRRLQAKVPAVVYGGKSEPKSIKLPENDVLRVFKFESAYTQMLDLVIDGQHETVVTKDVVMHPYKPLVMHIDFLRVERDKAITMRVPLHFIGEEKAVGVVAGGTAAHGMNDVEITCLPADLPESIDIDVSAVELGQTLHMSDLTLPKGVSFAHEVDADHDQSVFSIHAPHVEKEEESTEEAASDEAPAQEEGDSAAE